MVAGGELGGPGQATVAASASVFLHSTFGRRPGGRHKDTVARDALNCVHVRLQLLPRGLELAQGHHHVW
ncbi:MAG: hypothetical protein ACPIOQ_24935 [Promethearchaeia archaeon]